MAEVPSDTGHTAAAEKEPADSSEQGRRLPTSCRVCMSEFDSLPPDTNVVLLGCLHTYCEGCIEEWWGQAAAKSCPVCRQQFASLRTCQRVTAGTVGTVQLSPRPTVPQSHWRWRIEDEQAGNCTLRQRAPSKCTDERPHKRPALDPNAGGAAGVGQGGPTVENREQAGQKEEEHGEEWYRSFSAHPWIGRRGLRFFGGLPFVGRIFEWLPAKHDADGNLTDMALWKIRHVDGDVEDLEEYEVQAAIVALRTEGGKLANINASIEAEAQQLAEEDWAALRLTSAVRAQVAATLSGLITRLETTARVPWSTLSAEQIASATTYLGYDQDTWESSGEPPACLASAWDREASNVRGWEELSHDQQAAATLLGWTIESWDEEMLLQYRPADDHPHTSMFTKGERVLAFDGTGAVYTSKVMQVRRSADDDAATRPEQWQYRIHYNGWKSKWDEWMGNERVYKHTEQMAALLAKESSAGVGKGALGPKQLTKKQQAERAEAERLKREEAREAQRQKVQDRERLKKIAKLGREREARKQKLIEKQEAQDAAARLKREARSANQQQKHERKAVEAVVRELVTTVASRHKAERRAQKQRATVEGVLNRVIRSVEIRHRAGGDPGRIEAAADASDGVTHRKRAANLTAAERKARKRAKKEEVVQQKVAQAIGRMIKTLEKREELAAQRRARTAEMELRRTLRVVVSEIVGWVEIQAWQQAAAEARAAKAAAAAAASAASAAGVAAAGAAGTTVGAENSAAVAAAAAVGMAGELLGGSPGQVLLQHSGQWAHERSPRSAGRSGAVEARKIGDIGWTRYESRAEAAKVLNLDPSAISKCCRGTQASTHNYEIRLAASASPGSTIAEPPGTASGRMDDAPQHGVEGQARQQHLLNGVWSPSQRTVHDDTEDSAPPLPSSGAAATDTNGGLLGADLAGTPAIDASSGTVVKRQQWEDGPLGWRANMSLDEMREWHRRQQQQQQQQQAQPVAAALNGGRSVGTVDEHSVVELKRRFQAHRGFMPKGPLAHDPAWLQDQLHKIEYVSPLQDREGALLASSSNDGMSAWSPRAKFTPKGEIVRGKWSKEEDETIRQWVQAHGTINWGALATDHMPGRLDKQCRERWFNQLDPSIRRGPWSEEENQIILQAYAKLGGRWSVMSSTLLPPGRTDNAIKNHWNTSLKKRYTEEVSVDLKRRAALEDELDQRMAKIQQEEQAEQLMLTSSSSDSDCDGDDDDEEGKGSSWHFKSPTGTLQTCDGEDTQDDDNDDDDDDDDDDDTSSASFLHLNEDGSFTFVSSATLVSRRLAHEYPVIVPREGANKRLTAATSVSQSGSSDDKGRGGASESAGTGAAAPSGLFQRLGRLMGVEATPAAATAPAIVPAAAAPMTTDDAVTGSSAAPAAPVSAAEAVRAHGEHRNRHGRVARRKSVSDAEAAKGRQARLRAAISRAPRMGAPALAGSADLAAGECRLLDLARKGWT